MRYAAGKERGNMLRGYYTAANGIINEQRILDIISNNLANVKTAGYKADTAIPTTFAESLLMINGKHSETGTIRYRTIQSTYSLLEQGTLADTGSNLDIAIIGPVYFNIESYTDGRTLLTKNGQFDIDNEGFLELGGCGRVLDENGAPIDIGTSDFTITEEGVITTADGRQFTLGLSYIEDYTDVEKVGDNLFSPYQNAPAGNIPDDVRYSLRQGWYERSNVDVADEMIKSLDANNVWNANRQALTIMNSINQIACNDLMKKA